MTKLINSKRTAHFMQLKDIVVFAVEMVYVPQGAYNLGNSSAEANKLRELKSENLIFIKLKISENGMEWSRSENAKGEIESKLLPE